MDRDLNEGTIYPSTSDIHEDELKALSIPKSFDFGTVLIELTCLDVSTSYIIAGSACGALFVFNRKLSKMARPLRTNPFEHVSCIQQFNYVDDFVAVGHSTGSLVALRLPSSREGGSTSLAQCVDFDCHRRSSITCVAWNSDGTKIVSGNENGTVILSLVDFDKNEFKHNFVFEGCCSINTICLSYNSVIVHSDSKFNAIDIETFSSRRLVEIENSCDRQFVVKVRERKGTLLVVDNKKIVAYSPDFTKVVNTNEFKELGFTDHIIRAICTEDQLAVLTDNGYLAVFSIDPFVIIWKKKFQQELVHNFSLDIDGSVLYILKKRSIIRIGPNAVDYRLLKPNQESSAISTLLASPKKLFSSNVMKIATESGRSLINSAISIGIKVEVPKLPQDGINRVNIKQDLSNIMQTVQNFVDTSNQSFEEGIAITKTGQTNRSSSVEKLAVNNDLMVHRKEKGKRKKKFTEEEHENREEPSVSSERNVDLIETLRREILGDLFDGRPQSIESLTSISSLVTSPHDEVSTDEIENSGIISHFNTKDSSDCQNSCLSNGSSSPSTCEHNNYFSPITDSPIRKIKQVTNDELNTNEYDIMNVHTENFIKTSHEDQKFDLEAESSTLAYDYLIQKSSTYRNVNFESCLNITGQSPINHNGISEQYCHQSAVLNDRLDIWVSINLPFNAKAFTASSKHIIICHKKKNPRFIHIEKLGTKKLDWVVTNWKADYVDINDDESLFWRIHKNIGWSACEALCEGTNYTESATDGGGVKEVALRGHDAWYITKEGVSLQMELPHKAIFYRVDCDFPLCSITVSEDAVWAIRIDTGQLVVRVGLNKCRMGLDWVEICPDGPSRLRSICLFRSNGFALDCNGSLWMTNGVDLHHPYGNSIWYKICTPINTEITSMEQAVVKISSAGVFICIGRLLYLSRCALSGHRFLREVPTKYEIIDSFTFISCRSLSQNGLDIFLCRENSEMYIYRPMRRNFITRAMPPACVAVVGITSRQDVVSVIDSCGYVYSWVEGDVEWKRDDLLRVPICSISYSRISSWAVTCDGDILVKIGTENKWTTVVPPEMNGNKVTQVAVSPNGFFIWILSGGRAWARVGVNGRNLVGISWSQTFHCSDLCCVAVGDNVVWALDSEGILLRLRGLAAGNPAGNYWMNIAQSFRKIACDLDSCLWAIDIDNRLTRHSADLYIPKILPSFRPQNASDLIHDVIREAFSAAKIDNYTEAVGALEKPAAWETWGLGMVIISACSFSAPLGMLALPCLSKSLYERIMIFLIALGIGALSGSSMFIMIPQAFHLTELDDFNYQSKSAIIIGALYAFFSVDRALQYMLELRRRRHVKRRIHTSTIASIIHPSKLKMRHATEETTISKNDPITSGSKEEETTEEEPNELEAKEKTALAEELEIVMVNNLLTRTFSTRRCVAVMNAVEKLDEIEYVDPQHKENEGYSQSGKFLDTVNSELQKGLPLHHAADVDEPKVIFNKIKTEDNNDEVSVSIKVVEKRMLKPAAIEVASVAYMIIFGSSANNFVDGMSMGAAFSDSLLRGLSIGIAVVSQQFPQELGTLAILINSGLGFRRALLFNMIPIFLSYLGFVCGVLLDNVDEGYDDYIFSISSGMYMYIFLGTLIPEIRESCNELMKENIAESLLVTLLQFLGISSGILFMYYMSTIGGVEF